MKRVSHWLGQLPWKKIAIITAIAMPVAMIAVQCIYPWGDTRPYATIDGVAVGHLNHADATKTLEQAYQSASLKLFFGDNDEPYRSPTLAQLRVTVDANEAVNAAMYPWWLRLVPTSLWWGHVLIGDQTPTATLDKAAITAYMTKELGESCRIEPKNATITLKNDALSVAPAKDGGTCTLSEVVASIEKVSLSATAENVARAPMERIAPTITSLAARQLLDTISPRLEGGVAVQYEGGAATFDAATIRSWLTFGEGDDGLTVSIDTAKAHEALTAQLQDKVAKAAGVVTITTQDFQEVSRSGGGEGKALDVAGTGRSIADYVTAKGEAAVAATTAIQPERKYIRSYSSSDVGLSALMKNFAEDNPGTYGVSLVELSGQRRRAAYNDTHTFTTASTYKLYVAYSTLRRVENGTFAWSDQIAGGRNLEKCFDDMIVLSDNPCAEALVKKIGYTPLHQDTQGLGLTNTSFIDKESYKTTAGDLSTFMASLEAGQLPISAASRDRLIGALKRNVYRKGIPAGANGAVGDKVGFLDGLLHDAAIVYSPSGAYVLTIMTDGSSWGKIAELTREIEKLR